MATAPVSNTPTTKSVVPPNSPSPQAGSPPAAPRPGSPPPGQQSPPVNSPSPQTEGSHSMNPSNPGNTPVPAGANAHQTLVTDPHPDVPRAGSPPLFDEGEPSPGSKDYASTSSSANIGAPGRNRTVIGDRDSALDDPRWPPLEHEGIADEQRRRSDEHVKNQAAFAEQLKDHQRKDGILPDGSYVPPGEAGNSLSAAPPPAKAASPSAPVPPKQPDPNKK